MKRAYIILLVLDCGGSFTRVYTSTMETRLLQVRRLANRHIPAYLRQRQLPPCASEYQIRCRSTSLGESSHDFAAIFEADTYLETLSTSQRDMIIVRLAI